MSARYSTPGPWSVSDKFVPRYGAVSVLTGPLVDTRTGTTYPEGAYKVCVSGPSGKPRTRTFKGETAWSHAASYARDAVSWLNRWEPSVR